MKRYMIVFLIISAGLRAVTPGETQMIAELKNSLKPFLEAKKNVGESEEDFYQREKNLFSTFMSSVEEKIDASGEKSIHMGNVQFILDELMPLFLEKWGTINSSKFLVLRPWLYDRTLELARQKKGGALTVKDRIELWGKLNTQNEALLEKPVFADFYLGLALLGRRPDALTMLVNEQQEKIDSLTGEKKFFEKTVYRGTLNLDGIPPDHLVESLKRSVKMVEKAKTKENKSFDDQDKEHLWRHVFQDFYAQYEDELLKEQSGMAGVSVPTSVLKKFAKEVNILQKEGKVSEGTARGVASVLVDQMVQVPNMSEMINVPESGTIDMESIVDQSISILGKRESSSQKENGQKIALKSLIKSLKMLVP